MNRTALCYIVICYLGSLYHAAFRLIDDGKEIEDWVRSSIMVNVSSTLDERTLNLHKVFDFYIYLYCKFMTTYKLCDSLVVKNISHAEYSNMSHKNKFSFSKQQDQCCWIFFLVKGTKYKRINIKTQNLNLF